MQRIGIDAGGSLIKLTYQEAGKLHGKIYRYEERDKLVSWLQMLAPQAFLYGTGGKWHDLQKQLSHKSISIDEFPALVRGTNYLLKEEKNELTEYILVSIGTGTSIFHISNHSFERIMGTGIGGGTLMGLGSLIKSGMSFQELVEESKRGDRTKTDLLVKDIYGKNKAPLTEELTAANFGKAYLPKDQSPSDHLQALNQMIAEVILSLAGTVAAGKGLKKIVFIGSTLHGNQPLQNILKSFEVMLAYQPIFLDRGAYAGAIGAMLE